MNLLSSFLPQNPSLKSWFWMASLGTFYPITFGMSRILYIFWVDHIALFMTTEWNFALFIPQNIHFTLVVDAMWLSWITYMEKLFCPCRALSVIWTSPLVSNLGMSLTIPLAMLADVILHGRRYSTLYIVGCVQVNAHPLNKIWAWYLFSRYFGYV